MDWSSPSFPVHHWLLELAQTQVHWCHPTVSSSDVPFSSCLQPFPASESFPMSQFFLSGSQSIRASASASVLPMNIQDWFPLGLTGWISLLSRGLTSINSLALSFLYNLTLTSIHNYWKNHSFDCVGKVMSLLFNMLSRFVIAFWITSLYMIASRFIHLIRTDSNAFLSKAE